MNYSTSLAYNLMDEFDFTPIESSLLPNGFQIMRSSYNKLELRGRLMQSTGEDPLCGATKLYFHADNGMLKMTVKLGGVLFMTLFVLIFPPLLWLMLSGFDTTDGFWGIVPWLVISPFIILWIRWRTVKALNVMLANAIFCSNRP